jgi:hypothetical protein
MHLTLDGKLILASIKRKTLFMERIAHKAIKNSILLKLQMKI